MLIDGGGDCGNNGSGGGSDGVEDVGCAVGALLGCWLNWIQELLFFFSF